MEELSNRKKKIQKRKEEAERERRQQMKEKTMYILLGIGFAAFLIACIALAFYRVNTQYTATTDFSGYLTDKGYIRSVNENQYIKDFNPKEITINKEDIEYTANDADAAIEDLLTQNRTLSTDQSKEAQMGDTVNIDFVGTIDGVEFDGGNTKGAGADLTLGSNAFIDDFEEQLAGVHPGDDTDVEVTFPDDYDTEELQGQTAVFAVHMNGIYENPDLTDEFIKEHAEGNAETVDEYRDYLIAENSKNNLMNAIQDYIYNDYTIADYPAKYLHHMEELVMTNDQSTYQQNMQLYAQMGIDFPYDSYEDYLAGTFEDYDAHRLETAQHQVAADLLYQKIFKDNKMKISDEDYTAFFEENGLVQEDVENTYGKPFVMQQIISQKALEYLADNVTVSNEPSQPESKNE